jgi:hypothetical protein
MAINLITAPSAQTGGAEFYLGDVAPIKAVGKVWGFSLYGNDAIFIAQFAYADEALARRGAVAITAAMMGAVYVSADQDSAGTKAV